MLTVEEFAAQFPEYAFDFEQLMKYQTRILDHSLLLNLPEELRPTSPYMASGYKRVNRNQTRTHHQCASCHRVLRNDKFWSGASHQKANIVHTNCIECARAQNDIRYGDNAERWRLARLAIWRYIAPKCTICGFNEHPAAMDMHHTGTKEKLMSELIAKLASAPLEHNAALVIQEACQCIPLCSNCHRLLHAKVLELSGNVAPLSYDIDDLVTIAREAQGRNTAWQPRLFREQTAQYSVSDSEEVANDL